MNNSGTFWMPIANSTIATDIDNLFYFILYTSYFFLALITGITLYFMIKYRRQVGKKIGLTSGLDHNFKLEVLWTVIPTLIMAVVFVWGFKGFLRATIVPKDSLQIRVTGQRWFWTFDYPGGANSSGELVVPVGRTVGLLMTSRDVIHSFFVPAFRMKFDVIPNRYTQQWFEAKQTGEFPFFCAEYCGTQHSGMIGKVKVVSEAEYQKWAEAAAMASGGPPEELGAKLYKSKACFSCHSLDGSRLVGPSFKGAFGRSEALANGATIKVDENYIRESILIPTAKVVATYPPVMPPFQGLLKDNEIDALIAYIKTLK